MCPSYTNRSADDLSDIYLSSEDVELLMKEDSVDARVSVLEKISQSYNEHKFSAREQQFAEEIFRLMMRDAEVRVRQILSERVKENPEIPRDIVLHLAKDVDQVSIPVLQVSRVLSDADLVRIVESSREMSKLLAISNRETISSRVASALVDTHYPQVVSSLLKNENADILPKDYNTILSEFHREESIISAMVNRGSLPMPVVEKLVGMVSGSVATQLAARYDIDTQGLDQHARDYLTLELMPHNSTDDEIEATISQMIAYDRLTPSIILSALCRGYLRFFEIALAKIARIPKSNARKLIRDKGSLGFQALYQKTKLPDSMFEAVRLLLHAVIDAEQTGEPIGTPHYCNILVERMLQRAGGREVENLPYIMALVRQSVAHQA